MVARVTAGLAESNDSLPPASTKFIKNNQKFFTFDVSTSIRGLHQKKLVLGLLLPVLGAIVRVCVYSPLCHLNLHARNAIPDPVAYRYLSV